MGFFYGDISFVGFNVDGNDNLYFTDALTGNFYKLNTRSLSAENLYKLETNITSDGKMLFQFFDGTEISG